MSDHPGHPVDPLYDHLMAHGTGRINDGFLAGMLVTHYHGGGALPPRLGLDPETFFQLLEHHFAGATLPGAKSQPPPRLDLRLVEEKQELIKLMGRYRAQLDTSEVWMGQIVATGCMASNHLWQDLGLRSRTLLSVLMEQNFPALAARNDRNMKWKKFLYKQLCDEEGIQVCRAPSCDVCSDYRNCFGPEE
jgi:nitrogen fixation protein NifQ